MPAEILRAFKKVFPKVDVSRVTWSWEVPHKIYEAAFEQDTYSYEVEITVTGHHLLTEIYVRTEALPEGVRQNIEAAFPGAIIESVERVTYSNGDVQYEVDIITGDGEREVLVREDGLLLDRGKDPINYRALMTKDSEEGEEEEESEEGEEESEAGEAQEENQETAQAEEKEVASEASEETEA